MLPLGDGGDNPYAKRGLRSLASSVKSLYILVTGLTIFVILFFVVYSVRDPIGPHSPSIYELHHITTHCGSTSREAESRNCAFDILSGSWIPKMCIDHTTLAEYRQWVHSPERRNGSFPYFTDHAGKNRLRDEFELAHYNGDVFSTWEEHLGHCTFIAKRKARAYAEGLRLDTRIRDVSHTTDCAEMLLKGVEKGINAGFGLVETKFQVTYEKC